MDARLRDWITKEFEGMPGFIKWTFLRNLKNNPEHEMGYIRKCMGTWPDMAAATIGEVVSIDDPERDAIELLEHLQQHFAAQIAAL